MFKLPLPTVQIIEYYLVCQYPRTLISQQTLCCPVHASTLSIISTMPHCIAMLHARMHCGRNRGYTSRRKVIGTERAIQCDRSRLWAIPWVTMHGDSWFLWGGDLCYGLENGRIRCTSKLHSSHCSYRFRNELHRRFTIDIGKKRRHFYAVQSEGYLYMEGE